jgi:hypothetical protein
VAGSQHDIAAETARARGLFAAHGRKLAADAGLAAALAAYRREIEANWELMRRLEVVRLCGACAGERADSCCFAGAERWYYAELLLLNLLLGAELPDGHPVAHQCRFIGPAGCVLPARWSICINFFCPEMIAELGGEAVAGLRRQAGREIAAGLEAEAALFRALAGLGAA